ncbi:MarR family transcriptional regulator [Nocardia sp. NPDC058497]|uniref:MarR family transcriptional regulator n=1 Tax=Nocardia sp. NPDC058497 TaxID=3346529 RepID=UPI003658F802
MARATTAHAGRGERPTLYAAQSATPAVVVAARAGEYDLVTFDPPQVIVAGHVFLEPDRNQKNEYVHRNSGWGAQAVLRTLATANEPLHQTELARTVGISQQAVSQALKRAKEHVTREGHGWIAKEGTLQVWLAQYRGPGGTVTHWYGLDDPAEQARSALDLLDELDLTGIIGGDLAADRYSPWQLPGTVRMYLPELIDFTPAGFSPAQPAGATMTVVVPQDLTIAHVAAAQARPYAGRHLITDPAITLWDLLHASTTPTAQEAAQHLTTAIATGSLDV